MPSAWWDCSESKWSKERKRSQGWSDRVIRTARCTVVFNVSPCGRRYLCCPWHGLEARLNIMVPLLGPLRSCETIKGIIIRTFMYSYFFFHLTNLVSTYLYIIYFIFYYIYILTFDSDLGKHIFFLVLPADKVSFKKCSIFYLIRDIFAVLLLMLLCISFCCCFISLIRVTSSTKLTMLLYWQHFHFSGKLKERRQVVRYVEEMLVGV